MLSRSILASVLVLAASAAVSGCTPVTAMNGFVAVDNKPEEVKIGETRTMVASKLGSPSTTSAFDKNTWYYITQTTDKLAYMHPQLKSRKVVAISFDKDEKVTAVKALDLHDSYDLAYEKRETPTRGRELNWFEQLLGNVGRGSTMLPQDDDPGASRPGSSGGPVPH